MNQAFDGARVLFCLAFFVYASWSDLKKREVSNIVWVILAPIAFTLTFVQFFAFAPHLLNTFVLSFALTSAFSVVLFYGGAYGGADAKALICLALALPTYPTAFSPFPLFTFQPLFPLTVFCNAVLLAVLSVFYSIARNYVWKFRTGKKFFEGFENESFGRKILTFLCGYKVGIKQLEKTEHSYPLEDVRTTETGETERRLLVFPKDDERMEIVDRISKAAQQGKLPKEIWITPGLPMLIFITVGLIVALFFGDILWAILSLALRHG